VQAPIALLADAANVSREGKLNILGQFDTIWAQRVPMIWPMMTLVVKLEATAGEGPKHRLGVRVVDEDGNVAGPQLNAEVEFGKPPLRGLPYSANWILPIGNAVFQKYGTVTFEILADEHNIASIELYIREMQTGPQQP
jgi:hypothetical protein